MLAFICYVVQICCYKRILAHATESTARNMNAFLLVGEYMQFMRLERSSNSNFPNISWLVVQVVYLRTTFSWTVFKVIKLGGYFYFNYMLKGLRLILYIQLIYQGVLLAWQFLKGCLNLTVNVVHGPVVEFIHLFYKT